MLLLLLALGQEEEEGGGGGKSQQVLRQFTLRSDRESDPCSCTRANNPGPKLPLFSVGCVCKRRRGGLRSSNRV